MVYSKIHRCLFIQIAKKNSKLSFIIYLFHIKCFNGWTNKSFNSLLEVLKLALPDENTLPGSYHEMKKIIRDLGLGYEKIHACPNDCMLFWKENENGEVCLNVEPPDGKEAQMYWPVIIIPYNLPPWICMKQSNFILSLLISGPKGPGNNIDVYMQPLVAELHELWEVGVETFDAATNKTFQLRAALMWTINDFPANANLSGWSTRGEYACPCCGYSTASKWLKHSRKFCYMCHRRWLEPNHMFRTDKHSFDGTEEYRIAPSPPTGTDVLRQLEALNGILDGPWKKKSIFFSLPYWEHQLLRHNLDVMHIEKNICDNILGTLIGQEGKNKDTYKSRLDLVEMGIRSVLHPQTRTGRSTLYLPQASYQMTASEKNSFLKVLKEMKTPNEYSSNVSRCVHLKQRKLLGIKSYDCHLLMQEFLPIAIRGTLPEKVCIVLIALCNFFKDLCSKVLEESEFDRLELKASSILCDLEKIFPPSFFTIMMHLLIHLANEAKIGGPVSYRWMYPVERAHPEGSIAEGYLSHECLTFCSRYLEGIETIFNGLGRKNDGEENSYLGSEVTIFSTIVRPLGRKKPSAFHVKKRKRVSRLVLDEQGLAQAHRYVLFNSDEVSPYIKKQEQEIKRRNRRKRFSPFEIHKLQSETFNTWFRDYLKFQFQLFDSEEGIDEATLKHVKKWVLSDMTTKWRQWKNELKSQIFDENQTVEQIIENCKDPRVNLDQLKILVEYWLSSKAMTKEFDGIPPTRADVYVKSRTRKDGSIVNSKAAVVVERIQEKINESSSSDNLSQTSWSNDVFAQVKGPERRGRVRCVGAIHTRTTEVSGPSQSHQTAEEVEGLKSKVAKLEKLFETCFLPYFQQHRPDLHVPDMDALLRMVDTEATPDAGSASAAINSTSRSLPSADQQNTGGNGPSTQ
ncbi:hypothetical protein GQ457_16G015240 [Hibiscus cannabinus]